MAEEMTSTAFLLRQWHSGDKKSLEVLLERHLPWVRNHVRKRLGAKLRRKIETSDIVQDAVVKFLRYSPRFITSDDNRFRGILVRIVENVLRDKHDWFAAQRRNVSRERPIPTDTVLNLDPPKTARATPSKAAHQNEQEGWIRLGIELLEPRERKPLVLHLWNGLSFADLGASLGITSEAARTRYRRSVKKLEEKIVQLRKGEFFQEQPGGSPGHADE